MSTELSWRVSLSATSLHAAEAVAHGRSLVDAAFEAAIAKPARQLHEEIVIAGLPEKTFWDHLVPLSGSLENNRQLVEAAVRKTVAGGRCSPAAVQQLAGRIADLEAAVRQAEPDVLDKVARRAEGLQQPWWARGDGLLFRVGQLTDERLIAGSATVDLLYPVLGGGGVAHLPYNAVRIEAVEAESPQLPEFVRLAWLLSQLNVDLPVFSEQIPAERRAMVAGLAMLPPVVSAAVELEVIKEEKAIDRSPASGVAAYDLFAAALGLWFPEPLLVENVTSTLGAWWESYQEMRPSWNVALAALDEMCGEIPER